MKRHIEPVHGQAHLLCVSTLISFTSTICFESNHPTAAVDNVSCVVYKRLCFWSVSAIINLSFSSGYKLFKTTKPLWLMMLSVDLP